MTYRELVSSLANYKAQLVAVSKTKPATAILDLYNQGQRIFGENRVQDLVEKRPILPEDIEWHMIGHLQRNKVKYIAPFVNLIHSVDNFKLLKEINKQALKHNRTLPVLLQFHIAKEDSKSGFILKEVKDLLEDENYRKLKNIEVQGVMGMATFSSDMNLVRSEFKMLKSIFDQLKTNYFNDQSSFTVISMGMSGDYEIALEEGSNMVRIGSLLFGARN